MRANPLRRNLPLPPDEREQRRLLRQGRYQSEDGDYDERRPLTRRRGRLNNHDDDQHILQRRSLLLFPAPATGGGHPSKLPPAQAYPKQYASQPSVTSSGPKPPQTRPARSRQTNLARRRGRNTGGATGPKTGPKPTDPKARHEAATAAAQNPLARKRPKRMARSRCRCTLPAGEPGRWH